MSETLRRFSGKSTTQKISPLISSVASEQAKSSATIPGDASARRENCSRFSGLSASRAHQPSNASPIANPTSCTAVFQRGLLPGAAPASA